MLENIFTTLKELLGNFSSLGPPLTGPGQVQSKTKKQFL